jgi:hypothetical protein
MIEKTDSEYGHAYLAVYPWGGYAVTEYMPSSPGALVKRLRFKMPQLAETLEAEVLDE